MSNIYYLIHSAVWLASCLAVFHLQPAQSLAPIPLPHPSSNYAGLNRPYTYNYAVQDDAAGNAFHEEVQSLDGDSVTGTYQVRLPDGRLQTVTYTAGPNQGFVAHVSYQGEEQRSPQGSSSPSLILPPSSPAKPQDFVIYDPTKFY